MIQPSFTKVAITKQQITVMGYIYYGNNQNNIPNKNNIFTNISRNVCFLKIN